MSSNMTFTRGNETSEDEVVAELTEAGWHVIVFDDIHEVDEELHWHEFNSVAVVVGGFGSFADADEHVTDIGPGCRLVAEKGWLHKSLAGTQTRVVLGTDMPFEQWSHPINKDASELPASMRDRSEA